MGYFFNSLNKKELVQKLTSGREYDNESNKLELIKSSLVGNHLWTAFKVTNKKTNKTHKFINLYYDCPVGFFKVVPDTEESVNMEWRKEVIKFNEQKKIFSNLVNGDILTRFSGEKYTVNKIKGRRGIIAKANTGELWRLRKSSITEIQKITGEVIKL
jgi:preprotein translocase subunit YajC